MIAMIAVVAAASVLLTLGAAPPLGGPDGLRALNAAWATVNDYKATIDAHEVDGKSQQDREFQVTFMRPDHVKAEIVRGSPRGMVIVWDGGDKVTAYHHGFLSGLRLSFGLHDRFVASLRGNTVAGADFGTALECFDLHADRVVEEPGPDFDGTRTFELILQDSKPIDCPASSPLDATSVTKTVIIADRDTDLAVRVLRYAGDTLVEQWDIRDLRINTGLTDSAFQ